MLQQLNGIRHINSITHEGKVLLFATADQGDIFYTVKQDGFEDNYGATELQGWENWQPLFPPATSETASAFVPDPSVIAKEQAELTYRDPDGNLVWIMRSRWATRRLSALAPVQLVSGLGHLYVFRQSQQHTLLVDRFVLDGLTNRLVPKLDVRFKRSRQKYRPLDATNGADADTLDFRDADGNLFFEPTTELSLINHLHAGWFSVLLLPTNDHDKHRWHIFAYNSATEKVELTSIGASPEGLFDVQDGTVLEPNADGVLQPGRISGIIKRTLDLGSLRVTNGLAATRYDVQVERDTKAGLQLLREAVRVMLVIPTDAGPAAALSFAVAADGTLSRISEAPARKLLRGDARDILLPLNALDEIKALGMSAPPPQGLITALQRAEEDRVRIHFTAPDPGRGLAYGELVSLQGTHPYNGHYVVQDVDGDSFVVPADGAANGMGHWEKVPEEETGLIFDGIVTGYAITTDGRLTVTAPNHGLERGDEVQIVDTQAYDATCPVIAVDGDRFTVDIRWQPGEAVNLKRQAQQRRGISFDGVDDLIDIPALDLTTPAADRPFGQTYSAWIYLPARASGQQWVVGQKDALMQLLVDDGHAAVQVNTTQGPAQVRDPNPLPTNRWLHLAATVSHTPPSDAHDASTTLTLCTNGTQVAETALNRHTPFPRIEAALACNGPDDSVTPTTPVELGAAWTIEAWFSHPLPAGKRHTLIAGATDRHITVWNDLLGVWVQPAAAGIDVRAEDLFHPIQYDVTALTPGWHHLAAVGQDGQTRFYIDGAPVGTADRQVTQSVVVLGNKPGGGEPFGAIDELRVWNRARSESDIQANMMQRMSGTQFGLAGCWHFAGRTAGDRSRNQNAGLIHGQPQNATSPWLRLVEWKPEFTVGGPPARDTAAPIPRPVDHGALELDGRRDYIQLPFIKRARAISMWVNIPGGQDQRPWRYLLDARRNLGHVHYAANVEIDEKAWRKMIVDGQTVPLDWAHIPKDRWTHVYLESVEDFSGPINLMARFTGDEFLAGSIDEVRLWDRPRTAQEILADMDRRLEGTEPGLVGYWRFDDGQARHHGPQQKDGTVHGAPTNVPSPFVALPSDASAPFAGKIAEVQIWDLARHPAEIKDTMYLQPTGREVGLAGYWRLGAIAEGKQRKVVDFSIHHHDGIVQGGAFVGARVLQRTLDDDTTPAAKYVNHELFAVSGRATYVESFEFRVDPPLDPNDVDGDGTPLFNFAYWGQANRRSPQPVHFPNDLVEQSSFQPSAADGWHQASCRVTIPDGVTLLRVFGITDLAGDWDSMEIRKHRVQLVSDTITQDTYTDPVGGLKLLADAQDQLRGKLAQFAQKERLQADLIINKRLLEHNGMEALRDQVSRLEQKQKTLDDEYQNLTTNPFNYLCHIVSRQAGAALPLAVTGPSSFDIGLASPSLSGAAHLWRFEPVKDLYWRVHVARNDNVLTTLEATLSRDRVQMNEPHPNSPAQSWKLMPAGGDYYRITNEARGDGLALDVRPRQPFSEPRLMSADSSRASQLWSLSKTDTPATPEIGQEIEKARSKRDENRKRLDDLRARLNAIERDLGQMEDNLAQLDLELAELNAACLHDIREIRQTPQTMPERHTDARGLVTSGAMLSFLQPASRLTALETCEGNVQLSYLDQDRRLRLTNFDATADTRNTAFEQWVPDSARGCVIFQHDQVLQLTHPAGAASEAQTGIPLDQEWTIEAWFLYPLPETEGYNRLIHCQGDRSPLVVKDGVALGYFQPAAPGDPPNKPEFFASGYDVTFLSPGWHHLAVVGVGQEEKSTTLYYIDGQQVGDTKAFALEQLEDELKTLSDENKKAAQRDQIDRTKKQPFRVGGPIVAVGNHLSRDEPFGKVAELRVWKVALSAEEIDVNSKTLLSGFEPGLTAYLPLGEAVGTQVRDHSPHDHHGTLQGAGWWAFAAPVGDVGAAGDAVVSCEYTTFTVDPDTQKSSAMMRRFLASPTSSGVRLLAGKRVELLDRLWIGNLQVNPTLLGYIEGPPPVPSENLTIEDDYNGATSVELTMSEDMTYSWSREQEFGLGANMSLFVGTDFEVFTVAAPLGVGVIKTGDGGVHAGFTGELSAGYSWLNQSQISAGSTSTTSDRLELRGSPEAKVKFEHLGRRFIPKNVGYALVVSGTADLYIMRLKRSGRMVSYLVAPNPDIPLDVNTITFLVNPAYTMNGSLDGLTGSRATSDRFFRHVPEMRSQYGALYPASYYRIREAYALKQAIENQDKEREAYFQNFSRHIVKQWFSDIDVDRPNEEQAKHKEEEIEQRVHEAEARTHAKQSYATWQKKMENLQVKAGKRNIVNTYVWDADGGLRGESQSFANTVEHTIGSSFSFEGALGFETEFSLLGNDVSLSAQATVNLTQTLTKTESHSRGFALDVDVSGMEGREITDHNDYPLLPGEKVDRYRFMSFYLEGSTDNFDHFFDQVVDPEWLASNDEEARALRQTQAGRPNKVWRVLHRVTYVERPALMGFGRDLRGLATPEQPSELQQLSSKLDRLEQENKELKRNVHEILQLLKAVK